MGGPEHSAPERSAPLAAAGTAPATRVRFLVLAAGCGLAFLAYVHRQSFVRAQPSIAENLGLNDQQLGYLAAAFLIGYGLFQVPCGLLSDRFGARHLLAILVIAWSLLTGLQAFAGLSAVWISPLLYLIATRFAFGVAQAGYFPVWSRVMADWMPVSERGTAQGTVWMFSRLGGAVAPFLFGGLFELFGTWTTPLWVLAALGPCGAIPVGSGFAIDRRKCRESTRPSGGSSAPDERHPLRMGKRRGSRRARFDLGQCVGAVLDVRTGRLGWQLCHDALAQLSRSYPPFV